MRPIDRGDHPLNPDNTLVIFSDYPQARPDLINRLGEYCSYCEMHLDASLAVEHIQPKSFHPDLALEWDNFLLGCTNCNSTKNAQDIALSDCYWPDQDNTWMIFSYHPGGLIRISPTLNADQQLIAERTLNLTGLNRYPLNSLTASDRRWNNRRETWDMAEQARNRLLNSDTRELREQIVETAKAKGYWAVWMTVFEHDADMRNRLIDAFPGTCFFCLDPNFVKPAYCLHE